jgi:hypothetical protein
MSLRTFGALRGVAVILLLSGCASPSPSTGTLTGHLRQVGGPPPGVNRTVPGSVTVTGGGTTRELGVGTDGAFTIDLSPGTYTVVGHSPTTLNGDKLADCPAAAPVVIASGATTTSDPVCSIK